jgi:hypothetical protein
MGHAETLYPEYRKKLRATYKAPTRCTRYCCGWLGFEGEPDSAPNLKCIIGGGTGDRIGKSSSPSKKKRPRRIATWTPPVVRNRSAR